MMAAVSCMWRPDPALRVGEAEAGTAWGEIVNDSFRTRGEDPKAGHLRNVRRSYDVA